MLLGWKDRQVYDFAMRVIDESKKHDNTKKIDLFKLWLRIWIAYWEIKHNPSMNLDDYFWDSINLAARIMEVVPEGHIFSTETLVKNLSGISNQQLWEYNFHGIISPTELYAISDISKEELSKLISQKHSLYKECDTLIYQASCVSAILSAQPIPFVESFNIIGIHLFMIMKINW